MNNCMSEMSLVCRFENNKLIEKNCIILADKQIFFLEKQQQEKCAQRTCVFLEVRIFKNVLDEFYFVKKKKTFFYFNFDQ